MLPFEPIEVSAWVEAGRAERALRVLSDPRLHPTRIGSDDARTRRALADRFEAEAFDDLRRLAVATDGTLWIDRAAPLDAPDAEALEAEDIAIAAGSCTVPFLIAVPQCEIAPSFRRTAAGSAMLGIAEAFGRVEVVQAAVSVSTSERVGEGLRMAAAAAISLIGPVEQVSALGARDGTVAATVLGARGFGTLAVGTSVDATSCTLVGEGGVATVGTGMVAWRRKDGTWVEETRLEPDGDEPIVRTILEAEKPVGRDGRRAPLAAANRRRRLRVAALVDTIALATRTGGLENVAALLRGFGLDPDHLGDA
jgi:hypothetical protein